MSWRTVVITKRAKLELKLGSMVIRDEGTTRIHIGELKTLIIDSTAVSITSSLLVELMKNKIKIIISDEKHNPCGELVNYYGSHNCSKCIRQQTNWNQEIKDKVWTAIIRQKIWLQKMHLYTRELREYLLLDQYLDELEISDITNREGHAAKVYFNALFGQNFSRNSGGPINAALNYGYSLVLSSFNQAINAKGYLTQLGIWHDNQFNHFNLSCDLMEPFRPLIDSYVIDQSFHEFAKEEKMTMIRIFDKRISIQNKKQKLSSAIQIFTNSVLEALVEEELGYIAMIGHE